MSSPLLALRILKLLYDNRKPNKKLAQYLHVNTLIEYFGSIGFDRATILSYLDQLLKSGLVFGYDPTIRDIEEVDSLEISFSGRQHLLWGIHEERYIFSMALVTPIYEEGFFQSLRKLRILCFP